MLSYSSVHSLDQSGQSAVDSAHLHLLHLITVAHLVQILLTSTTGYSNTQQTHTYVYVCAYIYMNIHPVVSSTWSSLCFCLSVEEVCMDQDSGGSEEEELTGQLYNRLRKHLGRWAHSQITHTHTHTHVSHLPGAPQSEITSNLKHMVDEIDQMHLKPSISRLIFWFLVKCTKRQI